jgi:hypothetical protein
MLSTAIRPISCSSPSPMFSEGGDITAALVDGQRHVERTSSVSVAITRSLLMIVMAGSASIMPAVTGPALLADQLHLLGIIGIELHDQALDVEDDVGDVFHHAGQAGELVLRAFEADVGDGRAFQAAEQNSPQAVADGGAEAAFKRLGGEFSVHFGGNLLVANDPGRQLQSTPTNSHDCSP